MSHSITLASIALFTFIATAGWCAEYRVISSSSSTLGVGSVLQTGSELKLGPDETAAFIVMIATNAEQRVCFGPYAGPVELCTGTRPPCAYLDRVLGYCIEQSTGGSRDVE